MEQEKHTHELNVFNLQYGSQFYKPAAEPEKKDTSVKNDKLETFKARFNAFKGIKTLDEARNLLNKSMPVQLERTVFFIGDAKCTIINKSDQLRLCLQTNSEFISYNFI